MTFVWARHNRSDFHNEFSLRRCFY